MCLVSADRCPNFGGRAGGESLGGCFQLTGSLVVNDISLVCDLVARQLMKASTRQTNRNVLWCAAIISYGCLWSDAFSSSDDDDVDGTMMMTRTGRQFEPPLKLLLCRDLQIRIYRMALLLYSVVVCCCTLLCVVIYCFVVKCCRTLLFVLCYCMLLYGLVYCSKNLISWKTRFDTPKQVGYSNPHKGSIEVDSTFHSIGASVNWAGA